MVWHQCVSPLQLELAQVHSHSCDQKCCLLHPHVQRDQKDSSNSLHTSLPLHPSHCTAP
nr:hypothetical protein Iba_chr13bCG1780 [Ipomoea batatas]